MFPADSWIKNISAWLLIVCLAGAGLWGYFHYDWWGGVSANSCARQKKLFGSPAPGLPVNLTDCVFEDLVLRSRLPVLVEFSGSHCAMCQEVKPVMGALARNLQDRLRVCIIEQGDGSDSFRRHKVPGVPTFILFNQGRELSRTSGVSSTDTEVFRKFFKEWVEQGLEKAEQPGKYWKQRNK